MSENKHLLCLDHYIFVSLFVIAILPTPFLTVWMYLNFSIEMFIKMYSVVENEPSD